MLWELLSSLFDEVVPRRLQWLVYGPLLAATVALIIYALWVSRS